MTGAGPSVTAHDALTHVHRHRLRDAGRATLVARWRSEARASALVGVRTSSLGGGWHRARTALPRLTPTIE